MLDDEILALYKYIAMRSRPSSANDSSNEDVSTLGISRRIEKVKMKYNGLRMTKTVKEITKPRIGI